MKRGFRGLHLTVAFERDSKAAVYGCIGRTLCQHGAKLLLGSTGLIMLQIRTGQVEARVTCLRMRRYILLEYLLRLLPITGVLERGAKLIQCAFVAWMQSECVPISDNGILILALPG